LYDLKLLLRWPWRSKLVCDAVWLVPYTRIRRQVVPYSSWWKNQICCIFKLERGGSYLSKQRSQGLDV